MVVICVSMLAWHEKDPIDIRTCKYNIYCHYYYFVIITDGSSSR